MQEPASFNPLLAGDEIAISITGRIFETILGRRSDAPQPWLTQLADPNDIQTFSLTIDPAARWQDGAPVIEDDIVMSLTAAQFFEWFSDQWDVRHLGGGLVRIELAGGPNAFFVDDVLRRVGVLPQHIWGGVQFEDWPDAKEGNGSEPGKVIGCGPYQFNSWVRGDYLSVIRNDAYWGGQPARYQEVQWRFFRDLQSLIAARCAHEVDDIIITIDDGVDLDCPDAQFLTVVPYDTLLSMNVFFNLRRDSPLQDPAVRRALNISINRLEIAETLGNSAVALVRGTQSPLSAAFSADVDWQAPPFDPELALAELANAGIDPSDPQMQLSLLVDPAIDSRIVSGLQNSWSFFGGALQVEQEADRARLQSGDFDAWLGQFRWWPSGNQAPVFGTDGPLNFSGFSNPEYDEVVAQAKQEPDPSARRELLRRGDEIVLTEVPAIFLWYDRHIAGLASQDEGITIDGLDPFSYLD